ncbi:hypothetical protein Q9Q95_20020 [Sphingomonas sp. DG1-23]|uniref:hypothetical protein n=1 Tax=Sphingomonas sp. DG1-23 TaxID=3068316 RepID=UPI00273D75DE|nr:hypothetical protein [Sphingomonas sp. DG1-23]MDP5281223.1 hypothetical protein [Sphingomonas sp. DG1-23]
MPGSDPLVVVIVREAAVRSTLVARLAMSGANMCTAQHFDERHPASLRGTAAMLITDRAAIDAHPDGAAALLCDPQWSRIVVLTHDAAATSEDPRLLYLAPGDAAALTRLVSDWRGEG